MRDKRGSILEVGDFVCLIRDREGVFKVVAVNKFTVVCDCVNSHRNYKDGHQLLPQYILRIEPETLI